jgi:hypothetical protein
MAGQLARGEEAREPWRPTSAPGSSQETSSFFPMGIRSFCHALGRGKTSFLCEEIVSTKTVSPILEVLGAVHRSRSDGLKIGGTCYKEPKLWTGTKYLWAGTNSLWVRN